jgi:mannose-6-phosphate isomerase
VWGGDKLVKLKSRKDFDKSNGGLGETWEVSGHSSGPSFIAGKPLYDVLDTDKLPYLVKFIDAADDLSIQVHPGDEYAKRVEGEKGKTESWLILDHDEGAGIYLGLKDGVDSERLKSALSNKENINELLNFIPVKKGDFFFVPAGTIHAIGKGVTLAEIQQNSGVTYRVWDWNRLGVDGKARDIHVDKSLDVINFETSKNQLDYFSFKECSQTSNDELINHVDFKVDYYCDGLDKTLEIGDRGHYHSLLVLNGEVKIKENDGDVVLNSFEAGIFSGLECADRMKIEVAEHTQYLHIY